MATKKITDLSLRTDFDETCQVPVDDPSQTWRTTGQQILDFILANIPNPAITSKTGAYTLTTDDDVVLGNASGGGFTFTLPAASTCSGKIFRIKRTDNTPANGITIDGNASETIDGATTRKLMTQYESVTIQSDGSNWHVLEHKCDTSWATFTPTGSLTTAATYAGRWRRVGDSARIQVLVTFSSGTNTSSPATITIPTSIGSIDVAKIPNGAGSNKNTSVGNFKFWSGGMGSDGYAHGDVYVNSGSAVGATVLATGTTNGALVLSDTLPVNTASGHVHVYDFEVPITDWWA